MLRNQRPFEYMFGPKRKGVERGLRVISYVFGTFLETSLASSPDVVVYDILYDKSMKLFD